MEFSRFDDPKMPRRHPLLFLEFGTHQAAKDCLEILGGVTKVGGVELTLKWGESKNKRDPHQNSSHKRPRLTESEALESSTLYFRLPRRILQPDLPSAAENVRKWMEMTLEDALSEEGNRITAAEEPALQVEIRHAEEQAFGFLDFASHAAASMALATLTGSTDGGLVRCPESETVSNKKDGETNGDGGADGDGDGDGDGEGDDSKPDETVKVKEEQADTEKLDGEGKEEGAAEVEEPKTASDEPKKEFEKIWGVALHWAHPRSKDASHDHDKNDIVRDADCAFEFRRQHFPADSREDCWFCLASKGCEKHLITGVYQQCYAAMPKGAMHKGHVLLIPVAHSSQGAFMDKTVSAEVQVLQKALRQHAREEYNMDLFVFERAIQTRGGYHTHVQCVPVPSGLGLKLETTLRAQAKANNIDIREIQSPDLDISALLGQDEDDDGKGYFYVEVPLPGGREFKRFLYQVKSQETEPAADGRRHNGPRVPLQFGREVVAAVLGKSELAHWKACQVPKEEETKMATDLRQSFEKYVDTT